MKKICSHQRTAKMAILVVMSIHLLLLNPHLTTQLRRFSWDLFKYWKVLITCICWNIPISVTMYYIWKTDGVWMYACLSLICILCSLEHRRLHAYFSIYRGGSRYIGEVVFRKVSDSWRSTEYTCVIKTPLSESDSTAGYSKLTSYFILYHQIVILFG